MGGPGFVGYPGGVEGPGEGGAGAPQLGGGAAGDAAIRGRRLRARAVLILTMRAKELSSWGYLDEEEM